MVQCFVEPPNTMAAWFGSWMVDFVVLVAIASAAVYFRYRRKYRYWDEKGIFSTPARMPFGHVTPVVIKVKSMGEHFRDLYFEYKKKAERYGGVYMFAGGVLMVWDTELIKHIMAKDFQYFTDRGVYCDEKNDPLSATMFALDGSKWRNLRAKLSPTFTSGKMKMMFSTLLKCGDGFTELMDKKIRIAEPIDIKDVLARYTTDIIGSCAFGIECNSLREPDNEFRKHGKMVFKNSTAQFIKNTILMQLPKFIRDFFGLSLNKKEVTRFFMNIVKETVAYREKGGLNRNDFMHLLLQLKNDGKLSDDVSENGHSTNVQKLTFNEIAAQCFIFFLGGFETSSTTMTFCLYELCKNEAIQEKLRREVLETMKKDGGKITYDSIMRMPYMDCVISETLRKYPPVPILMRKCVKEYKIPDSDHVLSDGQKIFIPIYGMQMDPEYYPEPEKFNPDRFNDENKGRINTYTYMPFGEGPRNCIGMRFGLLQTKTGIALLLSNYRLTLNPKTVDPIVLDPLSFITSAKGDVWLDAERL